jgi:hypothetical protein
VSSLFRVGVRTALSNTWVSDDSVHTNTEAGSYPKDMHPGYSG